VGGGYMMLMGPADVETSAALIETPAAAEKVAGKASGAAAAPAQVEAEAAGATPVPKPAAQAPVAPAPESKAKPKPAKKPVPAVAANGLPTPLALALQRNDVVVVGLWGTGGKIDETARDEAAAGAAAAGAAFVSINVLAQSTQAQALTLKLGRVLRAPGVLVFTQQGALVNRLDGFRDRETVAQAAIAGLR
jgi:hypothetical protein